MATSIGIRALRAALEKSGLSQVEVERRIGAGQGRMSHWLAGRARPSTHFALQLQRLLGLDPAAWETPRERRHEVARVA